MSSSSFEQYLQQAFEQLKMNLTESIEKSLSVPDIIAAVIDKAININDQQNNLHAMMKFKSFAQLPSYLSSNLSGTLSAGSVHQLAESLRASNRSLRKEVLLHYGIWMGAEELGLDGQSVHFELSNQSETLTLSAVFVRSMKSLNYLQRFIETARRIDLQIPFVPDLYAARFYELRLLATEEVDWELFERMTSYSIRVDQAERQEQIQTLFHFGLVPAWNVSIDRKDGSSIRHKQRLSGKILVESNADLVIPEDSTAIVRVVANDKRTLEMELDAKHSIFDAYSIEDYDGRAYAYHQSFPIQSNQMEEQDSTSLIIRSASKEPTFSDLQSIVERFACFNGKLTIHSAVLERAPLNPNQLFRHDTIVLKVRDVQRDLYTTARLRALAQVVLYYYPTYADCRIDADEVRESLC